MDVVRKIQVSLRPLMDLSLDSYLRSNNIKNLLIQAFWNSIMHLL